MCDCKVNAKWLQDRVKNFSNNLDELKYGKKVDETGRSNELCSCTVINCRNTGDLDPSEDILTD